MKAARLSYQHFFEVIPDAAIVVDRTGTIVLANSQACLLFGYDAEDLHGQSIDVLIPESLRERHREHLGAFGASPALRSMGAGRNLPARRKDGSAFPGDIMLSPVNVDGVPFTVGIVRDVSERLEAQDALRESEEKYRHIVENASEVFYQVAIDGDPLRGRVQFVSRQAEALAGRPGADFLRDQDLWVRAIHPDDLAQVAESTRQILTGGTSGTREYRLWNSRLQDYRAVEDRITVLFDGPGVVKGYQGVARDITERKHREQELQTIAQIGAALRRTRSRAEILTTILRELFALLDARGASLAICERPGGDIVVEAATGQVHTAIGMRFAPGQSRTGQVVQSGQPYVNNEISIESRLAQPEFLEGVGAVACVPLVATQATIGALWITRERRLGDEDMRRLSVIADISATAIQRMTLFEQTRRDGLELAAAYDSTIEGWSRALDLRDRETEGHTLRVTAMTLRLGEAAGMTDDELTQLRRGCLLHDIGKMGIPDGILLKPHDLTDDEWAIMRKHPTYAYELLSPIAYLQPALAVPYCHHERWDGTGYPRGLKGEEIPLAARLFAVVDAWDALRSDRPYRPGWSEERVREHLMAHSGTHFDPKAVALFFELAKQ